MPALIISSLPDDLINDLPGTVREALDAYLDDKQSMVRMTERYISGHDLSPQAYNASINGFKIRKRESLNALRHQAALDCPAVDLTDRLAAIAQFLHYQEYIAPAQAKRGRLLQRYLSDPNTYIPMSMLLQTPMA